MADDIADLVTKNQILLQQMLPGLLPTIFTDGISSLTRGPGVVKFYMIRFDPSVGGGGPNMQVPAAQVVMTSVGFAATVIFFQRQLAEMLAKGEVSRELYDQMVATDAVEAQAQMKAGNASP
jgi:hypothetical protein